jgi:hypothetical protein
VHVELLGDEAVHLDVDVPVRPETGVAAGPDHEREVGVLREVDCFRRPESFEVLSCEKEGQVIWDEGTVELRGFGVERRRGERKEGQAAAVSLPLSSPKDAERDEENSPPS